MTESSVGYSQGAGTKIATYKFGTGEDALHLQRVVEGAGKATMMQIIPPTVDPVSSSLLSCEGGRQLVLGILASDGGSIIRVQFFDGNGIDMGSFHQIDVGPEELVAYSVPDIGWIASTTYNALKVLKIASNSRAYMQMAGTPPEYAEGVSGSTEPIWPTDGGTVTDGTCVWKDLGYYIDLYICPSAVISNSMGATYYKVVLVSVAGTITIFSDVV
jgi:hypothetical protein